MRSDTLKGLFHRNQFVTYEKWSLSREAEDRLEEEEDSSSTFPLNSFTPGKKVNVNDMDGYHECRQKLFSPRIKWDIK